MNFKILITSVIFLTACFFYSCDNKFDPSELTSSSTNNGNITGDTLYVELNPAWEGFNKPQAMIVGREPFLYVADTDNNRIVMMNLNGDILGSRSIKKPVAIAQDYKFNLIICAEFDTLVSGQAQTFAVVYKIDLAAANHQIGSAPIERLLPRSTDLNRPQLKYTGAAAFYDNSFYIARTGPNNSNFVDPDNSILIFNPKKNFGKGEGDTLIGRVPNIDPISSGLVSANQISAITSFNERSINFILTLTGNNSFKVQVLQYVVTPLGADYQSKFNPASGLEISVPNKFERPEGSAVDNVGNIYIADAAKDSVYKFNPFGDELQSFGGPDIFNQPNDVAFFDKTLYVVDTGNNRILRFILSTDL